MQQIHHPTALILSQARSHPLHSGLHLLLGAGHLLHSHSTISMLDASLYTQLTSNH